MTNTDLQILDVGDKVRCFLGHPAFAEEREITEVLARGDDFVCVRGHIDGRSSIFNIYSDTHYKTLTVTHDDNNRRCLGFELMRRKVNAK